ncbi:MAG: endonuclease/exonuclease/phosphatase family protein [Alphaproteobacteria bacterium]
MAFRGDGTSNVPLSCSVFPMRTTVLLVSLLTSLLWGHHALSKDFKIATWNLQFLAESVGAGCKPRTDTDYAELRRYAEALDADIIAFQEVESANAAHRVFDPELYNIEISARPAPTSPEECWYLEDQFLTHQRVGFAIRKGIRYSRNPDLDALGVNDTRWGVDITVHETTPLRLLAIHLKSGCSQDPPWSSKPACKTLFQQLPVLERWIDRRAAEGVPFIVLGDFNRRLTLPGDVFWDAIDDGEPANADLTLAAEHRTSQCLKRFPYFIDHIVLGRTATQLADPGSFEVLIYDGPEAAYPSDHCPVALRIDPVTAL